VRRFLALLLAMMLLATAAACGGDDGGGDDSSSSANSDDDSDGDIESMDSDGGFDVDVGEFEDDEDEDLSNEDLIEVVQDFWEDRGGDIDLDFERIPDERIAAIPGDDDPPICGGQPIPAEAVAMNAFAAPCPEGLTVAWDPELIDGSLTDLFGQAGPAVVFAHEFGHVVQFQSGVLDITGQGIGDPPSVLVENQADCYAGAWVQEQVEEEFGPFGDASALDNSLGAMIFVRDQPGSDPGAELAHGNGFDRVRAFQDGVDRGVEYCHGYEDDPPFISELPFEGDDVANQGNLPFEDVTELVIEDLDDFFGDNVDDFDSPGDPFDFVPQDDLEELHGEIGDGAVATVFGMIWAQNAQQAAGDDLDGEGPLLQRACLVGAWLGDILRDQQDGTADRPSGVQLSPGDLDETIITFLKLTDEAMSGGGVAFEAIGDMRQGVFGGLDDCRLGE
jgi:hypothetical protein